MADPAEKRHLAAVGEPPEPPDDFGDREPDGPEVIAEQAVLGTAILTAAGAAAALAVLEPRHFSRSAHRLVFEAVERLADRGFRVDDKLDPEVAFASAVLGELADAGVLSHIAGPGMGSGAVFLHSLIERAGTIGYHAPKVIAAAQQRNMRAVLASCQQIAAGPGFDPGVHLEQIRKLVEDASGYAAASPLQTQAELMAGVISRLEEKADPGLPTGIADLDALLGGLQPEKLVVVAARPGVGKSVLCLNLADNAASRCGVPVLFCSLEMSAEELGMRRIASSPAKVPLNILTHRMMADGDWDRLNRNYGDLSGSPLKIDDRPHLSLAQIRARLREMDRAGEAAKLLVIDYLGLLAEPKAESRQQAVAELARSCKNLAREFKIPVVIAVQLNRGPEHRQDKKPAMADLRESGEIEAAADIVILLHREDAYVRESPRAGEADLMVVKNRQGPTATVTVAFQGHYSRFVDMAPAVSEPTASGTSDDDGWTPLSAIGDES